MTLRRALSAGMAMAGGSRLLAPLARGQATIFMLHRFHDPDSGVEGHRPEVLRRTLAYLRRERFPLVSLEEVFLGITGRSTFPGRGVAFTIDDGYADHARIAAPVFAEFDCPVTTFATSGFLDGLLWFWWDRIEYVFRNTARTTLRVPLAGAEVVYRLGDAAAQGRAQQDFTTRCKRMTEADKQAAITMLQEAADVGLPERPPIQYEPMTWDELRAAERAGMTFAPHTVTHPILARTTGEQSRREITESWERLRAETAAPVPVFCYPNGQLEDFGDREVQVLRELGFLGAVTGVVGNVRPPGKASPDRFRVRRYGYSERFASMFQYVNGLESLKLRVRGEA